MEKEKKSRIVCINQMTDEKFINLFEADVEIKGEPKRWVFASRNSLEDIRKGEQKPDAVIIAATFKNGDMVFISEFRVPLGGREFGLPAGLIDDGEDVITAAKREMKEETGLDITEVIGISPPLYSSGGMTDENVVMVYVEVEGEFSTEGNEASEDITIHRVNKEERSELFSHGTYCGEEVKLGNRAYSFLAFGVGE